MPKARGPTLCAVLLVNSRNWQPSSLPPRPATLTDRSLLARGQLRLMLPVDTRHTRVAGRGGQRVQERGRAGAQESCQPECPALPPNSFCSTPLHHASPQPPPHAPVHEVS